MAGQVAKIKSEKLINFEEIIADVVNTPNTESKIKELLNSEIKVEESNSFSNCRSGTLFDVDIEDDKEDKVTNTENFNSFDYLGDYLPPREGKIKKFKSKLSNKACNDLKRISHCKQEKINTLNKKRDQVMEELCRNQFVEILLDKMINVTNIITSGKDDIIYHANTNPTFPHKLPKECAIKVYKTSLPEFKQWEKYIKDDHYFKDKLNKQITKETIQKKAVREKEILMRLKDAGIKCPRVITLKRGVLVTTFIGKNKKSAPKLKDVVMTKAEYYSAYGQVKNLIYRMYGANLVHGGISEEVILWHNKTCYITNVSRCVERSHKDAFDFLFRGYCRINSFFGKKCKDEISYFTPHSSFHNVVHLKFDDKTSLKKLRELFKTEKFVDFWTIKQISNST